MYDRHSKEPPWLVPKLMSTSFSFDAKTFSGASKYLQQESLPVICWACVFFPLFYFILFFSQFIICFIFLRLQRLRFYIQNNISKYNYRYIKYCTFLNIFYNCLFVVFFLRFVAFVGLCYNFEAFLSIQFKVYYLLCFCHYWFMFYYVMRYGSLAPIPTCIISLLAKISKSKYKLKLIVYWKLKM